MENNESYLFRILHDYIEKFASNIESSSTYDSYLFAFKCWLSVECWLSLCMILKNMYSDKDTRYFESFKKIYFNSFYKKYGDKVVDKIEGDKNYNSFVLNLYVILHAYKYCKKTNNFNNYEKILEDVVWYDVGIKSIDDFPIDALPLFCEISDFIVSRRDYKDMPNLSLFLIDLMSKMVTGRLDSCKKLYYDIKKIYSDAVKYNFKDRDLLSKIVDNFLESEFCFWQKRIFYDEILLYEDRYLYINDRLNEVEDRRCFKEEIFSYINKMNFNLFEELNKNDTEDSFKVCMDIVFDSDSYREMCKKLQTLVNASELYSEGKKAGAFIRIKNMSTADFKDIYCDKKVSYPNNTMNVVEKPKKIIDRMKYLYSRIDNSISYDFMDEIHYNGKIKNFDSFYNSLNIRTRKEKGLVKKIGRMLMRR